MPRGNYERKPTIKQEKAFEYMVSNGGNASKAMRDAKYSPETAQDPTKLTKSEGFKMLLKNHGLTSDVPIKALVKDIKDKEDVAPEQRNRTKEIELALRLHGMLENKSSITAVQVNFNKDRTQYE